MDDTSPEIKRIVLELMMKRTGVERMKMAAGMFDAARTIAMASFSSQLTDIEVKDQLCARFYRGEVDVDAFSLALRRNRLLRVEVVSEEMSVVLRRKTGAERLRMASLMFTSASKMLTNHLRAEHPDWDERRIHQEAARRLSHGAI